MKRPRVSIRLLLLLVTVIAVPFAVDQLLERKMRELFETIAINPTTVIADQPETEGLKQIHVDFECINLTSLADRLTFRRKIAVTFDEIKYLETGNSASGAVLAERQRNVLITPISRSID